MELENQVVSLELAQKLKELGVKQESLCGWQKEGDTYKLHSFEDIKGYRDVSAFTVAELGEMLPTHTQCYKDYNSWWVKVPTRKGSTNHGESPLSEADARAKMLIYLLENKLISND